MSVCETEGRTVCKHVNVELSKLEKVQREKGKYSGRREEEGEMSIYEPWGNRRMWDMCALMWFPHQNNFPRHKFNLTDMLPPPHKYFKSFVLFFFYICK